MKAHRSRLARKRLDSTGADVQMATPPYSLDRNPVALLWAWLKCHPWKTTARNKLSSAQRRPSILAAS